MDKQIRRDVCSRTASMLLAAMVLEFIFGTAALALPDDRNQPIYIQSDRAERDERKGTTVYTGDVEVDQGSLHISADRVLIFSSNDQVDRMEAYGNPARMQQKTSVEKEPVYARARKIDYLVANEELTLTGNASVTQEGAKMTGSQIIYYMREQRVKAGRPGASTDRSRVITVIPPRQVTPVKPAPGEKPADASPAAPASKSTTSTPSQPGSPVKAAPSANSGAARNGSP
jgi:lipopolysaccharide export system protein LptA